MSATVSNSAVSGMENATLGAEAKARERRVMPTYEFLCKKCGKSFEETCSVEAYERKKPKNLRCPKCGSSKVARQISAFEVKTSRKS